MVFQDFLPTLLRRFIVLQACFGFTFAKLFNEIFVITVGDEHLPLRHLGIFDMSEQIELHHVYGVVRGDHGDHGDDVHVTTVLV